MSRVSEDPKNHIKDLQPILDYVVSKMGHVGITRGKVLFAKDNRALINYLRQGKVDWITETPFSATMFERKAGAEIMLIRHKKGAGQYHSLFIARKDSEIHQISDLVGKIIAFEDSGSTSGFLLPASMIIKQGFQLSELASPREAAVPGTVSYIFAKQEMNISNMVYRGIVDAGAYSNLDWEESDRVNEKMKKQLRIFHRTHDVPRALELLRGNMDPSVKEAFRQVLLNAHEAQEAQEALKNYKKTSMFSDYDSSNRKAMESIRELADLIHAELM